MKSSKEIRNDFVDFFKKHDHAFIRSAPVVPLDDPTLLFTNAGMNQFKAIFLGDNPQNLSRAANSQKCMRVSGKHNDLEEVGRDHYHHTFFEMLGNWSFGDYYKKEAIRWGWELLTDVWKIPKDRLFATVHESDDEAIAFWKSETDIPHHRIMKFGDKSNFWEMGETGPCGPCTEIHYDIGDAATREATFPDPVAGVNGQNARYRELWNLVFMQYNREKDRSLVPLKAKHVDTGMGFERIVSVLQGVDSNYHTDIFKPIISELEKISCCKYQPGEEGTPFRVAADHIRSLVFAITDGAIPSNDGRGYVLRRLLRRAARFGREIGCREPFLYRLAPAVVKVMGEAFPEITQRLPYVQEVVRAEEERFGATLEQGINKFSAMVDMCIKKGETALPGSDVFALYDTYGFPMDLTRLMAAEKNLSVNEEEFARLMEEQKARGRESRKGGDAGLTPEGWTDVAACAGTTFLGYDQEAASVKVCRYKIVEQDDGALYLLILDKTPLYASSGGQVGDRGVITAASGKKIVVEDTIKWNDLVVHQCRSDFPLIKDDFSKPLTAIIDTARRAATRRNHSATHLLQAALRSVLGSHVQQSGSRVDPGSLRFDYTHFKAPTSDELNKVERMVNEWVLENLPVITVVKNTDDAKKEGAMALFGEKYGDSVRVVSMGAVSKELCGGTHVAATGQIGMFHITAESSIASGVRRIEAVTGLGAAQCLSNKEIILAAVSESLKTGESGIVERVTALVDKIKELETKLAAASAAQASLAVGAIIEEALLREGALKWSVRNLGATDKKSFNEILNGVSDVIKQKKLDHMAIVIGGVADEAVMLAACAGPAAVKTHGVHCGDIMKAAAAKAGGSGGGSPARAQAGGKDPAKLRLAIDEAEKIIISKANP
ncbi:MAG: alanine--tRNA ligase [Chitinispirillaceae bacterium]|jgi:alanyl-tRNA synthetase|nr:alanine--tRNA ligase [Chitinispirillaceae bacterium]